MSKTYEEFIFLGFDNNNEEQRDFIEFIEVRAKELEMAFTISQIENFVVSVHKDAVDSEDDEDEN